MDAMPALPRFHDHGGPSSLHFRLAGMAQKAMKPQPVIGEVGIYLAVNIEVKRRFREAVKSPAACGYLSRVLTGEAPA
jgi:hypothetical protein